ncbi:RIP metalloprotease RseP [Shouchella patagoniensis]|uniref:RIP metalloprotease RseP n=1 Tax=Shouchella patagoniensis TaxID=228576 RepID=UPI0009954B74|nr:RIP metalloprotease RseP [Shouchella patagoniensis]
MNTLLAFIAIFSVLVFVHEWGHLYFAKKAGILCYEFAIGMGPKLFAFERNDTIYTVRLLPIGGYVRMAGEEPEQTTIRPGYEIGLVFDDKQMVTEIIINNKSKHPEAHVVQVERIDLIHELFIETVDEESGETIRYNVHEKAMIVQDEVAQINAPWHRQFGSKSLPKRAMAIFAGPMMNFILAFVILLALSLYQGVRLTSEIVIPENETSPAQEAGLETGDVITSIEGTPVSTWNEMTAEVQKYPNQEIALSFERNGEEMQTNASLEQREVMPDEFEGVLGVQGIFEFSFLGSLQHSAQQFVTLATSIFDTLSLIFTGQFSLDYISGPVGIYDITDQAVSLGLLTVINFAALLSINLGVINLFPIPALDGGRLMFLAYEGIRGKPVSPEKEGAIQFVGFALVMLLMIIVTWNDISKLFS